MLNTTNTTNARALAAYIAATYPSRAGQHKPAALLAAAKDLAAKVNKEHKMDTRTDAAYNKADALAFIFGERATLGMASNGFAGNGETSRQGAAYRDYFAERYTAHAAKPRTAAEKLATLGIHANYAGLYRIYDDAAGCFKAYDSAAAALKAINI